MKNPLRKDDPVVSLPTRTPVNVEAEIADIARTARRNIGLGGSREMERAKELLTSGLTAAYADGASALEHAIDEANNERESLKRAVEQMDAEMDRVKRQSAEHILHLKSRCSEITAGVEARLAHLGQMLLWLEGQKEALQNPPQPARAALALEKPVEELAEDELPNPNGSRHRSE
jgi:hypothetical protein